MTSLRDRIRQGEDLPQPLAAVLQSATGITRLGMAWRFRKPLVTVPARVLSFGNLSAGGTGKTPAVIERAHKEVAAGARVAVLSRGYGSRKTSEPLILAPGTAKDDIVALWGDEPALIRSRVPEILLVKSADRVAGARAACDAGATVILLDDGYQSVQLARDENVLVVHAANPFGSGHLIPRGILREPVAAAKRATHFLLTHCDRASESSLMQLEATLRSCQPEAPIRRTWHKPQGLQVWGDGDSLPLSELEGAAVTAVCGIAHPESFVATLRSLGAEVTELRAFPDHAPIPPEAFRGTGIIVTTEKDAVRAGAEAAGAYVLLIGLEDWRPPSTLPVPGPEGIE